MAYRPSCPLPLHPKCPWLFGREPDTRQGRAVIALVHRSPHPLEVDDMASVQAISDMKVTPTANVARWSAKPRWWGVAGSVAFLPIWGPSVLAMWGIDKLRRQEATVKAGYRWEMGPLLPGVADIPLDETAEHLRKRWASTGKRITVSTRLPSDS